VLCEMRLSHPSVDTFSMALTCVAELDERSVTYTTFCICLLQWMYTVMVELLFSTTFTRAEVWLVLLRAESYPILAWMCMLTCVGSGC
jgi:hypothetical protein